MGEFGQAPTDRGQTPYGQENFDFPGGYGDLDPGQGYADTVEPGYDHGGYQDEIQALVPENVPMIAAILMEKGLLSTETLYDVLAKQQETGDTLVQILLDEGVAAPDQLVEALQTRASYR